MNKYKVIKRINENGVTYEPDSEIQLTPERALQLKEYIEYTDKSFKNYKSKAVSE